MNGSNNINSLYFLIKQESQKKGRKLKIICDWDEYLQPFNVLILYKVITQARNTKESKEEFVGFFESFHNNNGINMYYNDYLPFAVYERDENGEYKWKNKEIMKLQNRLGGTENLREEFAKIKLDANYYEKAYFLSIAEDLLKCLKEGLINKLVIVSASNGTRKNDKTAKTFGKLTNVELSIQKPGRFRERGEYRWQWIQKNHPDFDIFVDDNFFIIQQAKENLLSDKIYVLPDYKTKCSTVGKNIYHLKTLFQT